jgi:hypothetical protein
MNQLLPAAAAALLALVTPATASFHIWKINEVYTNVDGSVQFIELFSASAGQQFLSGHGMTFRTGASVISSFTFPGNSGTPTDNKTLLLGTANLSSVFGVAPDFVIAPSFFATGATNFLDFENGFDVVSLASLPAAGFGSLNAVVDNPDPAVTGFNRILSPTNFAGQTGAVPEPSAVIMLAGGLLPVLRRRRAVVG